MSLTQVSAAALWAGQRDAFPDLHQAQLPWGQKAQHCNGDVERNGPSVGGRSETLGWSKNWLTKGGLCGQGQDLLAAGSRGVRGQRKTGCWDRSRDGYK